MSERIGRLTIIEAEDDNVCELCGKVAETRPYGPDGKEVCFECGMKDEKATNARMARILFGDTGVTQ
jgi:hypothetical protein